MYHDEYAMNNLALPVPGLAHLALAHSSWSEKFRGGVRMSSLTTEQENADFEHFASSRTAPRARCGERPQCSGSCTYDDLACDINQTEVAYMSMVSNKVPIVDVGLYVPKQTVEEQRAQFRRGLIERNWSAAACSCEKYPAAALHPRPPRAAQLTRSNVVAQPRRGNAIANANGSLLSHRRTAAALHPVPPRAARLTRSNVMAQPRRGNAGRPPPGGGGYIRDSATSVRRPGQHSHTP